MRLVKHMFYSLVILVVGAGSSAALDVMPPDSILTYTEHIVIPEDGTAEVTVTVQIAVSEIGKFIVPLNLPKAENFTQVSDNQVRAEIINARGIKYIGFTVDEELPDSEEVFTFTYTIPGFYVYADKNQDRLGRIRFRYSFHNSVASKIAYYKLTVLFAESYDVHFVGALTNIIRGRSNDADDIHIIADRERGKRGFFIEKKDVKYSEHARIQVEITDKEPGWPFLVLMLAFGAWAIFYYRDHLKEEDGEEKQLVKGLD